MSGITITVSGKSGTGKTLLIGTLVSVLECEKLTVDKPSHITASSAFAVLRKLNPTINIIEKGE